MKKVDKVVFISFIIMFVGISILVTAPKTVSPEVQQLRNEFDSLQSWFITNNYTIDEHAITFRTDSHYTILRYVYDNGTQFQTFLASAPKALMYGSVWRDGIGGFGIVISSQSWGYCYYYATAEGYNFLSSP